MTFPARRLAPLPPHRYLVGVKHPLLAVLLCACAKHPRPLSPADAPPTWIEVRPGTPLLCVSQVAAAGRDREGTTARMAGLAHLAQGDLDQAATALAAAGDHPAAQAARLALTLRSGDADAAAAGLLDLLQAWPDDGCLHQAAAYAALANGRVEGAARLSAEALRLLPDAPEVLFLDGLVAALSGDLALATTRYQAALALQPGHPGVSAVLGAAYLLAGQPALALPPLRAAIAGGVPADLLLMRASYAAGDLGQYVQVAASLGMPLPEGPAIAASADPLATYQAALGLAEGQRLLVALETSLGTLRCELLWRSAPVAVGSFVGLARGTQPWLDPRTEQVGVGPYYDGTVLHRVIPEFMVQGGDPLGTGIGGPGYRFPDEIDPSLRFDHGGVLAMANQGPDTNGSQFFVTEGASSFLDGKYTIFGQCDAPSVALVQQIARVPTAGQDRPATDVVLQRVVVFAE